MKPLKAVVLLTLSVVMLTSFVQCKSSKEAKRMEEGKHAESEHTAAADQTQGQQDSGKQLPLFIRDAYFQRVESVITIYFPILINKNNYKLEKVYFRNMIGEIQSGKASYFASLTSNKEDIVMSNAENAEYGNTMPTKPEPFPFKLKDNECIISYLDKDETKYFQVYNIVEN